MDRRKATIRQRETVAEAYGGAACGECKNARGDGRVNGRSETVRAGFSSVDASSPIALLPMHQGDFQ